MSAERTEETGLNHYSLREIIRRMWPMVRPRRRVLLVASLLVSFAGLALAAMPIFSKYVIDVVSAGGSMRLIVAAMGTFLIVQFGRMLAYYVSQKIIIRVQEEVVFAMRSQGFRHLQRLCLRFHDRFPTGFLHDRVFERSICTIGMLMSVLFSQLSLYATSLLFALAACLYLNVPMTGVILMGVLGYVAVSRTMAPRIRQRTLECADAHNWICAYILDRLRGTKTIQAYALEETMDADFDARVWPVQDKYVRARMEQLRLQFVSEGLGYLITAVIHVLGAYAIFRWNMQIGTLVAFIGYQAQLIGTVTNLTSVYGQASAARAGFDQLFTVLDTRSSVWQEPGAVMPASPRGQIAFRDVTFGYDGEPVLKNVRFTVPPGQSVALVGRSGAGKTTITNLLLRFYDPDAGEVLLDDVPIRRLPLRDYRARFGVVLQEPFLFDDTIEHNLRCAKPDATDEEVREALRKACALDFAEAFPEGIRHRVGEGGRGLSGGQRQRLAIARCMLLDPACLILDEATSALDAESELLIQGALDALFRDRTAFIIAHRLSTIRHVDRILVFDRGHLVEDGGYDELLSRKGLFHRLHTIATSTSLRRLKLDEAGFA